MNWFKNIFFSLSVLACNNSYLLDLMFESINASLVDYFIVFILGSVFATLRILSVEITATGL